MKLTFLPFSYFFHSRSFDNKTGIGKIIMTYHFNSNTDLFVDFKTLKQIKIRLIKCPNKKKYKFELPKKLIIKSGIYLL